MRVFVLTSGRAASTTFARAAKYIDGMTAGHETRKAMVAGRLDYPPNHIESDNRLAWFLGSLDRMYDDADTFYVYLHRNPAQVAHSYRERWHIRVSMVRAFYHGMLMHRTKPDPERALDACRLFADTLDDNIRFFLKHRSNWAEVSVENLKQDFFLFMDKAGLSGDREGIAAELDQISNPSKRAKKRKNPFRRLYTRFSSTKLDM